MTQLGLQLYSLKELCREDFFGTLNQVAAAGYEGVEFAGYFETPSKQLKNELNNVGLKAAGSHIGMDTLESTLDQAIQYSLEIENPYIICPGLPESYRDSADAYKRTAEILTAIGERCTANGLAFGYHNHDVELQTFDGEHGLELLFKYSDPTHVFMELDTFWLEATGLSSVNWIEQYKERVRILHMKDMNNPRELRNVVVGSGTMDVEAIVTSGKKHGVEWYTVEQEQFDQDQMESVTKSATYLKSIL
ncbi:sugar phosphate isomerase/epimerase family protein [Shouchella shacheensis]|uniref:sugar phosphate isomerase/epimerase family protein n=1 Tax=Shouchella shacheensis TaxID=1649580 RepID=UPI0007402F5A|nr:sugar phosphate isomerase/epimerase [Shouchella shacheensis]